MKFIVITHVLHKKSHSQIFGYGPYVKEMNLWFGHVDRVRIVGPLSEQKPEAIDLAYKHADLELVATPPFNVTSAFEALKTLFKLPIVCFQIFRAMMWADHIHLRCPGNMGLLGTIVQIFFPHKMKTAKYAGNWDPKSAQPWSYRVQKWILSNPWLTRKMKVLVYGEWPEQSQNIVPFFTATYHERDKEEVQKSQVKDHGSPIRLIYVGTLSAGKRPMLSVKSAGKLKEKGLEVHLDIFGEGAERRMLEAYINEHALEDCVTLHGNQNSDIVKEYYKSAHFLIFVSRSEGWPKVVAEAMFWGCLPITTDVSCVNYMIGDGKRGKITQPNVDDIVNQIQYYLTNPDVYERSSRDAKSWSRQFTLEKFANAIGKLLDEK